MTMTTTIQDPQGFQITECYECGDLGTLVWKSRCGVCTARRLEFNMNENDELREVICQLTEEE